MSVNIDVPEIQQYEDKAQFDPKDEAELERYRQAASAKTTDKETQYIMEGGQLRARFKIEIRFTAARSLSKPTPFMMQIHESGKFFHGGADDGMYWCKDVDSEQRWDEAPGCGKYIPSSSMALGKAMCPHCFKIWPNTAKLTGQRLFVLLPDKQAEVVERQFRELGSDADIYCKFHKEDIRYMAYSRAYGEELAHKYLAPHIYTLARLMADLSAGSSLRDRIRAFLVA
jgi:hypothetical protein